MVPGETLFNVDAGNHLWVVVSVASSDGQLAIVNFTGFRPGEDSTCLVHPGEHPFVSKLSCIKYRFARMQPVEPLRDARERRQLQQHEPVSVPLLLRIQQGALVSRFTPVVVQKAVRSTLGR